MNTNLPSNTLAKTKLEHAFSQFDTYWDPKVIAELNGQMVKIAKLKGEFVWHQHEHEDEYFLVVKGTLRIELREREDILLKPGECVVIPKGIEHRPVAQEEVHVLLFEPSSTINTGELVNKQTKKNLDRL